jgi:hypothetical protein
MTDQEISTTIAEALGWAWQHNSNIKAWAWHDAKGNRLSAWHHHKENKEPSLERRGRWPTDRNAAVEAVIKLCDTDTKMALFVTELEAIVDNTNPHDPRIVVRVIFAIATATAHPLCEALIRSWGKWKENP